MRYDEFIALVQHDPKFNDFRVMFEHEPLQRFVYSEKCIQGSVSEKRVFYNEAFNEKGGIAHSTQMVLDDCYGVFTPFQIKALWIPLTEGECYTIEADLQSLPIIRNRLGKQECLFFVHPKSEDVYADLLTHYAARCITLSALSLSSPRSLLIALPTDDDNFEPVMVKVSLNQQAHQILRLLSERECALSVANTSIFKRILKRNPDIPLSIFEDTFSFVPKVPQVYDFGMSYRILPDFLHPRYSSSEEPLLLVPMLAFYGQHNADFFKEIVQANGNNVTTFLKKLFELYIQSFLTLLLDYELSMEAHGQNLLLVFDKNFQLIGIRYRDMGGVNTCIDNNDFALPLNLRKPELSYFHNHVKDASNSIEHHFVWRGLYPITKQLVKHAEYFVQSDEQFNQWYQMALSMHEHIGVLGNWTDGDASSDLHQEELPIGAFCRYGYAECLFGEMLIDELERRSILDQAAIEQLKIHLFCPENLGNDLIVAPCTYKTFFDETIRIVLNSLSYNPTIRNDI